MNRHIGSLVAASNSGANFAKTGQAEKTVRKTQAQKYDWARRMCECKQSIEFEWYYSAARSDAMNDRPERRDMNTY